MVSKNLSVTNFDPSYLRTGKTELPETFFRTSMAKSYVSKNCKDTESKPCVIL